MAGRKRFRIFIVALPSTWSSVRQRIEHQCPDWEVVFTQGSDDAYHRIRQNEAHYVLIDGNLSKTAKGKVKRAAKDAHVDTTTCTPYADAQINGMIAALQRRAGSGGSR
jgi:hypothetical protein